MTDMFVRVANLAERAREQESIAVERRRLNREAMPETAALVDELQRVFGRLKGGWFEENGRRAEWGSSVPRA